MINIKPRLFGRPVKAFVGFAYHFVRYVRYSGWKEDLSDTEERNYLIVKIYHALEKSLSFRERRFGAGIANANRLKSMLTQADKFPSKGFQDTVAPSVLQKFGAECGDDTFALEQAHTSSLPSELGGIRKVNAGGINRGILADPEAFFFSRHSLRDFDSKPVSPDILDRALNLSISTPSVCNRQPWHVYRTEKRELIDIALSHQNGNRGFGHKIPCLMVITADLRAFGPGTEHYQHWIDGGLYSMSLIYALHSLGLASCCLNWSASPVQDIKLRAALRIKSNHTIIMLLGVGLPLTENIVCYSARRPLHEISTQIL